MNQNVLTASFWGQTLRRAEFGTPDHDLAQIVIWLIFGSLFWRSEIWSGSFFWNRGKWARSIFLKSEVIGDRIWLIFLKSQMIGDRIWLIFLKNDRKNDRDHFPLIITIFLENAKLSIFWLKMVYLFFDQKMIWLISWSGSFLAHFLGDRDLIWLIFL